MARRRRRRRKSRNHCGRYASDKCPIEGTYRSGWELSFAQWLEKQDDVVYFQIEPLSIPYVSNKRTGKIRQYHPDFLVRYADGHEDLIEIKPSRKVENRIVRRKSEAAARFCQTNGMCYRIITEIDLKASGAMP